MNVIVEEQRKKLFKQTDTTLRFLIKVCDIKGFLAQLNSKIPKDKKKNTAELNRAIIKGSLHSCVLPPKEAPVTNERLAANNNPAPTKSILRSFSSISSVGLTPSAKS